MVNEVVYTHGIAQTPWGGVKDSGYGKVGAKGAGSAQLSVYLTTLPPIHTGHIGAALEGAINGRENGHVSDTVGGTVAEDLEEVPA